MRTAAAWSASESKTMLSIYLPPSGFFNFFLHPFIHTFVPVENSDVELHVRDCIHSTSYASVCLFPRPVIYIWVTRCGTHACARERVGRLVSTRVEWRGNHLLRVWHASPQVSTSTSTVMHPSGKPKLGAPLHSTSLRTYPIPMGLMRNHA